MLLIMSLLNLAMSIFWISIAIFNITAGMYLLSGFYAVGALFYFCLALLGMSLYVYEFYSVLAISRIEAALNMRFY